MAARASPPPPPTRQELADRSNAAARKRPSTIASHRQNESPRNNRSHGKRSRTPPEKPLRVAPILTGVPGTIISSTWMQAPIAEMSSRTASAVWNSSLPSTPYPDLQFSCTTSAHKNRPSTRRSFMPLTSSLLSLTGRVKTLAFRRRLSARARRIDFGDGISAGRAHCI